MASIPYRRIIVVGVTGSGKSMLAEQLARKLGLVYTELDALYWKPGWVDSGNAEFREKVDLATRAPGWVLAGNYAKVRDIIWPRAEALVWLDYPFLLALGRLWSRTWHRWWTKELLWGTNYERLLPQFKLGRKSRCLTGWCKAMDVISSNIRNYSPALITPTYSFSGSNGQVIRKNGWIYCNRSRASSSLTRPGANVLKVA